MHNSRERLGAVVRRPRAAYKRRNEPPRPPKGGFSFLRMTMDSKTLRARRWRVGTACLTGLLVTCIPARVPPPDDLGADPVRFHSGSGSTIHGWLSRGRIGAGAIVLLHGIGASRQEMIGRARFLRSGGFSVLAIDFRGHGDSTGGRSTYGGLESRDALAAVEFLRHALPLERIGVIGISMGGAAVLLGQAPLPVQALVLESVYPTIDDAVRDRLRAWLGPIGRTLAPIVMTWLFPRDGVAAADLRPIDHIREQTAPVFVLAGSADRYTPPSESRSLFDRAPEPKAFWSIEGAGHVDLHEFAGAEYERRVGAFLARHLRDAASGGSHARASSNGTAPPEAEEHAEHAARGDRGAERHAHSQ